MLDRLRGLYAKLPVIRELRLLHEIKKDLREIASKIGVLRADQAKLVQREMADFEARLVLDPRYADPRNLMRHERHVYSQFGEDGIITEIFHRIGSGSRTFAEIGIGTGVENNTVYLLLQGWKGSWIDANERSIEIIRKRFRRPIGEGRLKVERSLITAENIEAVLAKAGCPAEPDLFSLDIDRNTYWAWAAMKAVRPRVAVIEYNGYFPPDIDWKVDYEPKASWAGTMYFGASLKAIEALGTKLGYNLVGCNSSGVNAFFVRQDLCGDHFEPPFTAEKHYEPFRQFLERSRGFRLCFDDLAEPPAE